MPLPSFPLFSPALKSIFIWQQQPTFHNQHNALLSFSFVFTRTQVCIFIWHRQPMFFIWQETKPISVPLSWSPDHFYLARNKTHKRSAFFVTWSQWVFIWILISLWHLCVSPFDILFVLCNQSVTLFGLCKRSILRLSMHDLLRLSMHDSLYMMCTTSYMEKSIYYLIISMHVIRLYMMCTTSYMERIYIIW